MLISHGMRFGTDEFGFSTGSVDDGEGGSSSEIVSVAKKQALLIAKSGAGILDCSDYTTIVSFDTGECSQPSGTKVRFIFKVDDAYKFFSGSTLTTFDFDVSTNAKILSNVLAHGNTIANLAGLSNSALTAAFVGKKVYPVIALEAPGNADAYPYARLKLKATTTTETLSKTVTTAAEQLTTESTGNTPIIDNIIANISKSGSGSATIQVRLQDANENWSSYMSLSDAAGKDAVAVQYKIVYKVTVAQSTDAVKVNQLVVTHTAGKNIASAGSNLARIYTNVVDFDIPLQRCYLVIRHEPFMDSALDGYVNFMRKPDRRELISIGTTTGALQEVVLGVNSVADKNIDTSSIEIYVDGKLISDFAYNSEVSTVALKAKVGYSILASYNYNHGVEVWRHMTYEGTEPYSPASETCASYFSYSLPDSEAVNQTVSNVCIRMKRNSGTVTNENLGKTTGKRQMFVLDHQAVASSITLSDTSIQKSFNSESNILTVQGTSGKDIKAGYKWTGTPISVHSFAVGWSVA